MIIYVCLSLDKPLENIWKVHVDDLVQAAVFVLKWHVRVTACGFGTHANAGAVSVRQAMTN